MATALYRVLVTAQLGEDAAKAAVYEQGAMLTLDEDYGDACPYVERADGSVPSKKKKAAPAEG